MKIIELSDYTMVIQKEESDSFKEDFLSIKEKNGSQVKVFMGGGVGYMFEILKAKEALFSPDVLILYFSDKIPEEYQIGSKVGIKVGMKWIV